MIPTSGGRTGPPEEPDRSPDKPGPAYPMPTSQLELSAYKVHVIAKYFDDVKSNTSQLVRAIIFLWAVFIIPLILLCIVATFIDWTVLPLDWKWVTGIGCLGTMALSAMARAMARRRRDSARADRSDSTPDAAETGRDGFCEIADQIAAENADND